MAISDLPPDASAFVSTHLKSAHEAELLLALIEAPDRWWDAELASRCIGIPGSGARAALDRFAAGNLLDIRVTDRVCYRFQPGTERLLRGATAFAEAYRADAAKVIQSLGEPGRRLD